MTWTQCTFLPDMGEDFSQTSFLDTDPSLPLNGTNTPAKSLENAQQTDGFLACKCGKGTLDCSIHPSTPEKWIASMRDSLANLLALPENVKALKTREETSSRRLLAVWKSSDPNSSFWKMYQDSPQADPRLAYVAGLIDGEGCIRIAKQSNKLTYIAVVQLAMTEKAEVVKKALLETFGGNCYAMEFKNKNWARQWQWRINGEEACEFLEKIIPFLILKKPQALLALQMNQMRKKSGWHKETRAKAEAMKQKMHLLNMRGPNAQNAEAGWFHPSPDLFGIWNRYSQPLPRSGMTQNGFVYELPIVGRDTIETDGGYWPTPATRDYKGARAPKTMEKTGRNPETNSLPDAAGAHSGMKMNPQWVEWLMGFPAGFTALKDSETHKSRFKPQQLGDCSEETN